MDPNNLSDVEKIIPFVDVTTLTAINAFLTGTIATFVAWVAFREYRLSRAKFKFDLFNHRYDLYIKTKTFVKRFNGSGSFTNEDISQFGRDIEDVKFFYGKTIYELMCNLYKLANEHHCHDVSRNPQITSPTECQNHLNKMHEIREKITNIQKDLDTKMNKCLNFEKWK